MLKKINETRKRAEQVEKIKLDSESHLIEKIRHQQK